MKFQTTLMIAMVGLVVLVTWVVMAASRGRVVAAYTELYEGRYESQVAAFLDSQQQRIEMLEEFGRRIVEAGELPSMLERLNGRPEGAHPDFDTMRERMRSLTEVLGRTSPAARADASGRRQRAAVSERVHGSRRPPVQQAPIPLVCVMTADGALLPVVGMREGADRKRLSSIREAAGAKALDGQGVRYLAVDLPDGGRGLREVVVTPVFAEGGEEQIGALVVGADPRQALGSRLLRGRREAGGEAVTTGIVVGGEFHGETEGWQAAAGAAADRLIAMVATAGGAADEGAYEHPGADGRLRVHFKRLTGDAGESAAFHLALYSLAPLDRELAGLRDGALAAGGLGLVLAVVLSYLLARALTVPVRELSKGTGAVARGEFGARVPVRGGELGQLAASFNSMAAGLAMKEKYRSVLGKVADEAVAEALVAGELELGGEEIEVSILFCDIRGFTTLSDGRAPSEVIALLNEHMTAMTEVVYEHRGVVDKFVGDEIMAVFGAPKAYGDDAANACRCALAMVARRERANIGAAVPIEIGVGVATGRVVAGCMGSESRLNYTVVGDRVNLAARLCGVARAGEVVVDAATWASLDGFAGEAAEVELKGIPGAVPVWRLGGSARREARGAVPAN